MDRRAFSGKASIAKIIDDTVNNAADGARHVSDEVRHMQSGNLRSYAGWIAAGAAVVIAYMIWMGVAMNIDHLSPYILTLVTFVPLAGALLLMLLPRRDRDIRIFSLVISLLAFVLSLHLPVHLHRGQPGFQFEIDKPWISQPQHPLPHGHRRHLDVAGGAHHIPYAALRADLVEVGPRSREGILHPAADPRNRSHRRLHFARSLPLLLLLGSHADSDGTADRRLWTRAQSLRGSEILSCTP